MRLLLASGLLKIPSNEEIEKNKTAMEMLLQAAERFLRGGGTYDLTDWKDMLPCERGALVTAREKIEAERAALAGLAAQDLQGAVAVFSKADGGKMKEGAILDHGLAKLVLRMRGLNFGREKKK